VTLHPIPNLIPTTTEPTSARDRAIITELAAWFDRAARPLPWRSTPRNPYHALVAEAMLQQTQVSRVVTYFTRFIARFPTLDALAAAPEQDVLALWSGLGYYRRARSLHAAAQAIIKHHAGVIPTNLAALQALPGVGRYTAGAIASIALGQPAPIVDGNVARVLLRLEGQDQLTTQPRIHQWAWLRAQALADACAAADPAGTLIARFNEGLMELGATICLPAPAQPHCLVCPLRERCLAQARGVQAQIPPPKPSKKTPHVAAVVVVICDTQGRVLLEQRSQAGSTATATSTATTTSTSTTPAPTTGMWAGLWQCPTLETLGRLTKAAALASAKDLTQMRSGEPASVRPAGDFEHQTTHRAFRFHVFAAQAAACVRKGASRRWMMPVDLHELGLSSAASRALQMGLASAAVHQHAPAKPAQPAKPTQPTKPTTPKQTAKNSASSSTSRRNKL